MKKIYILTGYAGTGKTSITNKLKEDGWYIISAGEVFIQISLSYGIKNNRHSIQKFSTKYFNQYGYDTFTALLLSKVGNQKKIIFEGIRPVEVINKIKYKFSDLKVIFIDSKKSIRMGRLKERNNLNQEEILSLQNHSIEKKIVNIRNIADFIIYNNNSLEETIDNVNLIL